ncbi:MAG: S8 family peptidase, partial [Clostridia bacterium]|nr:S8 family peptidase [Clostridia bacterium]
AKQSVVSFITKQTKVSAQIDVSKNILGIENFYNKNIYGEDVTIAIIDTGISPHLDFLVPFNRVVKFVDLINNKTNMYDDNGHGTFVASIACGCGTISGNKNRGIAYKTKIVSIKALEENGETGAFKILEAMQWVYNNKDKYNIKVVCMSFGSSPLEKNDPLVIGAESLWNIGIVVVAAAGNSGPENQTIKSPGYSSKIITVGGLNDNRDSFGNYKREDFEIASFSSRGPAGYFFKPDVIAPAVNITGASNKKDSFYTVMSGTSVATPMIAGVCCLILSKYPQLSPDQLKIRLLRNCKQITNNKNFEGFGLPSFEKFFIY